MKLFLQSVGCGLFAGSPLIILAIIVRIVEG